MSTTPYTTFVSSFGALETGIMGTLAGGSSYFLPFAVFGYFKTKSDIEAASNRMKAVAESSKNPRSKFRRNIYGKDLSGQQNSYFWALTVIAVVLGVIAISLLSCLIGITPDENFKECKRRRRRLLEDPKITPEELAYTIANCTPNQYRYN